MSETRLSGTVLSLDVRRAFGYVRGDDGGRYFVHRQDVADRPTLLECGERVSFLVEATPKGPRARNVMRVLEPTEAPRTTIGSAARFR